MDLGTVIGMIMVGILLVASIIVAGSPLGAFFDAASVIVVFMGAACAILICFPMKRVFSAFTVIKKTIFNQDADLATDIEQIVSLAESARREGLLSLENRIDEIDDTFLKLGVRMAIDGMGADIVESIMRTEIDAVAGRHEGGKALLDAYGKYCPAFGMIGTLIGLVVMLGNMDPETIGSGMAVALLTTLYGAVAANGYCLPLADKLAYYSSVELLRMEVVVRGVIAIQAGENPRVIKQKLLTFVPPNARPVEDEKD